MTMPELGEDGPKLEHPEAVRDEWVARLHALAAQVKPWVERSGWRTRLVSKPTRDPELGRYEVPLLLMERDGVQIALNPVSRFATGSDGGVDLYVVPAYDEVAGLHLVDDAWTMYYVFREPEAVEAREPEALDLTEGALNRVLDAMALHVD